MNLPCQVPGCTNELVREIPPQAWRPRHGEVLRMEFTLDAVENWFIQDAHEKVGPAEGMAIITIPNAGEDGEDVEVMACRDCLRRYEEARAAGGRAFLMGESQP